MLSRISRALLMLAPLAVISACQSPDVGQECMLSWGDPATAPMASELYTNQQGQQQGGTGSGDYVEFNAANGCENLVCIVSPAAPDTAYGGRDRGVGYCSKPCVANRDCYQEATGLECRSIVLDADFLATLDPATRDRYLGDIQYSSYCAVAR